MIDVQRSPPNTFITTSQPKRPNRSLQPKIHTILAATGIGPRERGLDSFVSPGRTKQFAIILLGKEQLYLGVLPAVGRVVPFAHLDSSHRQATVQSARHHFFIFQQQCIFSPATPAKPPSLFHPPRRAVKQIAQTARQRSGFLNSAICGTSRRPRGDREKPTPFPAERIRSPAASDLACSHLLPRGACWSQDTVEFVGF